MSEGSIGPSWSFLAHKIRGCVASGHNEDAEGPFAEAFEIRKRSLGSEHWRTLEVMR
jgi:hypothetical protein